MKKLFFILFVLISLSGISQTPVHTIINQRYSWLQGKFNNGLRLPLDTLATTDTGSLAFKNGKLWVKKVAKWDSVVTGSVTGEITIEPDIATLRAADVAGRKGVLLQGLTAATDGNGGEYYYDAASTSTDDAVTVIDPAATGAGRWLKVFKGRTRAKEFNILTSAGSQTTKITAMIANATVRELVFDEPGSLVAFNGKIDFAGKKIRFENGAQLVSDGGGNDTLYNALIDADHRKQTFGTTLTVTGLTNDDISAMWFGAKHDSYYLGPTPTDNYPILIKAVNSAKFPNKLHIPGTDTVGYGYSFSLPWRISRQLHVYGDGDGTSLIFPGQLGGISTGENITKISDLSILGTFAANSSGINNDTANGLLVRNSRCSMERVTVNGFNGNGFLIKGDVTAGTNSNLTRLIGCSASGNGMNGLMAVGGDVNCLYAETFNGEGNAMFGIHDKSFLQITVVNFHIASNVINHSLNKSFVYHNGIGYWGKANSGPGQGGDIEPPNTAYWEQATAISPPFSSVWNDSTDYYAGGSIWVDGANQQSTYIGGYIEGDQPPIRNNALSLVVGGFASSYGYYGIGAVNGIVTTSAFQVRNVNTGTAIRIDTNAVKFSAQDGNVTWGLKGNYQQFSSSYQGGDASAISFLSPAWIQNNGSSLFGRSGTVDATRGLFLVSNGAMFDVNKAGSLYKEISVGTAAPTTGFWGGGDIVFNIDSSASTTLAWRCTSGGQPGTWETVLRGASGALTGTVADQQIAYGNGTAVTSSSALTFNGTALTLNSSLNGILTTNVTNTSSGSIAQASHRVTNNGGVVGEFGVYSTGNSGYGAMSASRVHVYSPTHLVLMADNAGGTIILSPGGNAQKAVFKADGSLNLVVPAMGSAASLFLVSNSGDINSRTAAQTLSDIGAAPTSHVHAAADITSGTIATARLGSGTANSSTILFGDQTYKNISTLFSTGSYTPTLFNVTNVTASTPRTCYWYRVGDMVTVFGELDIDPTTTLTATELGFSLDAASLSNFADDGELSGTAVSEIASAEAIAVLADITNDRATFKYTAVDVTNHTVRFQFSYKVTPP